MFHFYMCCAVSCHRLMISKARLKICFGVIITVFCTSACEAQNVPALDNNIDLFYKLDASENTVVLPGQRPIYTCQEFITPGMVVQWMKDNVPLGSRVISTLQSGSLQNTSKKFKRRAELNNAQAPRKSHLRFRHTRSFEDHIRTKLPGGDLSSSSKRGVDPSLSSTGPHFHSFTNLPQPQPHYRTTEKDSYNVKKDENGYTVYENGSLRLPRVNDTSVGEYRCIISNSFGQLLRRKFRLLVAKLPQCSIKPPSQNVSKGIAARFECPTISALDVKYTWLKDGKPLPQTHSRFTFLSNGVLQITNSDVSDAGLYSCRARSKLGEAVSGEARLTVDPTKEPSTSENFRFAQHPQNLTLAPPYENAIFECLAASSKVKYGWTKKEGEVRDSMKTYSQDSRNLILDKVTTKSKGHYTCALHSSSGTLPPINHTAYLKVLERPTIDVNGIVKKPQLSQTVRLSCIATKGEPKPKIQWLKNGVPISHNRARVRMYGDRSYLDISTVRMGDIGYYQCIGENEVGAASGGVKLGIHIKDDVPPPLNVSAVARSATEIFVQWQRPNTTKRINAYTVEYGGTNLQNVNGSETSTTVRGLKPYTTYHVKVLAYTTKQTSKESETVQVRTNESEPCEAVSDKHMEAIPVNSTAVLLSWQPLPKELQCGIINKYKIVYANEHVGERQLMVNPQQHLGDEDVDALEYVVITGLDPGTNYGMTVTAGTKVGFGEESGFVEATVFDAVSTSCSDSDPVLRYLRGKFLAPSQNGARITVAWELRSQNSSTGTNVTLKDGRKIIKSQLLTPATKNATFNSLDSRRAYIVNIGLVSFNGTVCENHSFVVLPQDRETVAGNFVTHLKGNVTKQGCVDLSWKYESNSNQHVTYSIRYSLNEQIRHKNNYQYATSSKTNVNVCGLNAWSGYEFAVAAVESSSAEPLVEDAYKKLGKILWTLPDRPGPPRKVGCVARKQGIAECSWVPPTRPNGEILYYNVWYRRKSDERWMNKNTTDPYVALNCLEPDHMYIFKVSAATSAGTGLNSSERAFEVEKYDHDGMNCTFGIAEDTPGNPLMEAVVVGVVIAVVCFIICAVLLLCCVPTSRCLHGERGPCKYRKKNVKKFQKNVSSNKHEEVILISSPKNPLQNGHPVQNASTSLSADRSLEQRERLLPNGNGVNLNGNGSSVLCANGLKNGYTKQATVKKNGLHKEFSRNNGTGPISSEMLNGVEYNPTVSQTSKKRNSALFESFMRSLTLKSKAMAVPEADQDEPVHNVTLLLSVPIPKHASKTGGYTTSSATIPKPAQNNSIPQQPTSERVVENTSGVSSWIPHAEKSHCSLSQHFGDGVVH